MVKLHYKSMATDLGFMTRTRSTHYRRFSSNSKQQAEDHHRTENMKPWQLSRLQSETATTFSQNHLYASSVMRGHDINSFVCDQALCRGSDSRELSQPHRCSWQDLSVALHL